MSSGLMTLIPAEAHRTRQHGWTVVCGNVNRSTVAAKNTFRQWVAGERER